MEVKVWGKQSVDIRNYVFKRTPDKEFSYSLDFEKRLAAKWAGYTWTEFEDLVGDPRWMSDTDSDCKANVIASYRIARLLEAIENDVEEKK